MATLRETRRRIQSVKSTQKITRAMEMISSVKMRKARMQVEKIRPYAEELARIAGHLATSASAARSLFTRAPEWIDRVGLVVIGSDRGLCGSFNSNLCKKALEFLESRNAVEVELFVIGRKPLAYFGKKEIEVPNGYEDFLSDVAFPKVDTFASRLSDQFTGGKLQEVYFVYNAFAGPTAQVVKCERILPFTGPVVEGQSSIDFILEPQEDELVEQILKTSYVYQVYRRFLESHTAEQCARRTAMNAATKSASDLIDRLTLMYNKSRQSVITNELLEIISGSESLRKA